MTSPFPALEKPKAIALLRWVIGVVLVFGLIGCVVKGADNPPDPYVSAPSQGPASRTRLVGFGETRVTVHSGDKLLMWCLLLAANNQQRSRGLMEVKDRTLGGYDGMLFRYDTDVTESFWMRNTPMPLSIAYITSNGQIITTADMEPCSDSPDCRDYPPAGPYRFTIEVPQGNLGKLGLVPGATIVDDNAPCS
ncbi:MAG: uncharacterized protein QOH79_2930 [Acidimicrobiaceae bacterium]